MYNICTLHSLTPFPPFPNLRPQKIANYSLAFVVNLYIRSIKKGLYILFLKIVKKIYLFFSTKILSLTTDLNWLKWSVIPKDLPGEPIFGHHLIPRDLNLSKRSFIPKDFPGEPIFWSSPDPRGSQFVKVMKISGYN